MAVVSVRLNKEEEEVLNYLSDYFREDKSTLFKKGLQELYEDVQDIRFIESYCDDADEVEPQFVTIDELLD